MKKVLKVLWAACVSLFYPAAMVVSGITAFFLLVGALLNANPWLAAAAFLMASMAMVFGVLHAENSSRPLIEN